MAALIRHAEVDDAQELAILAARTFADTFARDNRPEDLRLHLDQAYGVRQQRTEIEDRGVRTLLCELAGALAGYAQVRIGHAPPCVPGPDAVELWRLYVDRPWLGRDIAQELMAACRREAEGLGGRTLWLGVWERNPRAIAFYRKCGFVDVGSHVFRVGQDEQTDRVMVSTAGPGATMAATR